MKVTEGSLVRSSEEAGFAVTQGEARWPYSSWCVGGGRGAPVPFCNQEPVGGYNTVVCESWSVQIQTYMVIFPAGAGTNLCCWMTEAHVCEQLAQGCTTKVVESTLTRFSASSLKQVANLSRAQTLSASCRHKDGKRILASELWVEGWRPSAADRDNGMSAHCTASPLFFSCASVDGHILQC